MQECGDCTLCCTLFEVKWLDKPRNTPCVHCDAGCTIHDTKPNECSDFDCSWRQSGVDNDALRPDRCGIVFEKLDDEIFYGTVDPDREISDVARRQLKSFVAQGYTVKLSQDV